MPVKESDLRAAAARVSSDTTSFSRSAGGTSSTDADWEVQQSKIARALVADPDLVTYFAYLVSNRACALAQSCAETLGDMVVLVEGWKYTQGAVAEPAQLQQLLTTLDGRSTISDEDIARLRQETATYIKKELAPQISRKGRSQVRGDEAIAAFEAKRAELIRDWKRLVTALTATMATRRFTVETVRNAAVKIPLAALKTTAGLLDPTRLTDFTVQLAAATAAVAAMGRKIDLGVRLRAGGDDDFPGSVTVDETAEGDVVTELLLSTSPKELGVKSGDTVTCAGASATVLVVSDTSLTLGDSTVQTTKGEEVEIVSTAYAAWEVLVEALDTPFGALPSAADLLSELQRLEGDRSAARIRALMERMATLAALLDEVGDEVQPALDRVGGALTEPLTSTVAALLRAFAPLFGAKTRQAGDTLLRDLEDRGFDYAVEMLYKGEVDDLLEARAAQVSRVGRVTEISSTLGTYTGGARGVG